MVQSSEDPTFCWNRFQEKSSRDRSSERELLTQSLEEYFSGVPGYRPTPLFQLKGLARKLGLGTLLIKDESSRLNAGSFKILGTHWAVHRLFEENPQLNRDSLVLSAASEGNHGRAVANVAASLGLRSVIYLPEHVAGPRIEAILREGARVVSVEGSYQDAVDRMVIESAEKGFEVISDTGYPGYETIPGWVSEGYQLIFHEAEEEIARSKLPVPDLVLLQGGVGTFASSGVEYFRTKSEGPKLVVVEPVEAACLLASALNPQGELREAAGCLETRMSGLNCSRPSSSAWPVLRAGTDLFLAVRDDFAIRARAALECPQEPDSRLSTSESGSAGLAGLLALCFDGQLKALREPLGLNSNRCVLIVNTEGANDRELR